MKISSRTPLLASAAVSLAALAVYAPASQAEPNKNTPTESGCFDITGGTIDFTRDLALQAKKTSAEFTHEPDLQQPFQHPHTVVVDSFERVFTEEATALVEATTAAVAGADCSDVTYRLRVFDESHTLLADLVVPSSGNAIRWETGFVYPANADGTKRAAFFSGTTETSNGRVIDTAPNDPAGLEVEIGEPPANSSFN